jgi:exodeoxyribonuclease III
MRLISWNVNGIRAVHKKGLLLPFLKEYDPDVLCLQETKAEQQQSLVDLPQYIEYWNSAERKGYSGTAIFTKEKPVSISHNLPPDIVEEFDVVGDTYGDPNTEGRVVVAEYDKLFVATVYTPNAKDDLSRVPLRYTQWDPAFLAYMKQLDAMKPVIFCGDLNVAHTDDDLARPKENKGLKGFTAEERQGVDNIVAASFTDSFRLFTSGNGHYTWWSHFARARERNIGWRIDYVFTSNRIAPAISDAKILDMVMGSDHCPVLLDIAI